ncbi:MAG: HAD hydrolase-like protein [Candidatus Micrarchaeota archaeon]
MREIKIHSVLWDFGGPIRDSRIALNDAHNASVEKLLGRKLDEKEKFKADDTWKVMGLPNFSHESEMIPALWAIKIKEIKEGVKVPPLTQILKMEDSAGFIREIMKRYSLLVKEKNGEYEKTKKLKREIDRWGKVFKAALQDKEKAPVTNGTREAMEILTKLGIKQAIVTNAREDSGKEYIQTHVLPAGNWPIVGSETFKELKKPHPYPLLAGLHLLHKRTTPPTPRDVKENGINLFKEIKELTEGSVYIGDTPDDVRAANEAGFISVVMTEGMGNLRLLKAAKPDLIVKNPEELAEILKKNNGKLRINR